MGLYPKLKGCPQPRLGNPGSATESVKYVISMKIKIVVYAIVRSF